MDPPWDVPEELRAATAAALYYYEYSAVLKDEPAEIREKWIQATYNVFGRLVHIVDDEYYRLRDPNPFHPTDWERWATAMPADSSDNSE